MVAFQPRARPREPGRRGRCCVLRAGRLPCGAMAEAEAKPKGRPARNAAPEAPAGPQPCSACRATGRVFANRAGEQITVDCPWCQGSGSWEPGFDAQAAGVYPSA